MGNCLGNKRDASPTIPELQLLPPTLPQNPSPLTSLPGMLWKTETEIRQVFRWMPMDIQNNDWEDDQGIKDIQAPLVRLRISRSPQREIDHTIDRTDENAKRSDIRSPQDRLPVLLQLMIRSIDSAVFLVDVCKTLLKSCREAFGGEVKANGDDAEETEAGKLNRDADLRDFLAFVGFGDGVCLARSDGSYLNCTPELKKECD
jgi:hypothetical protein